ncbi:MAG: hypothetical protein AAGA48_28765 [Myxococcota bacterium]
MFLVRRLARAKWELPDGFKSGDIPADAITGDLRTKGNSLSLWRFAEVTGQGLDDAFLALAATKDARATVDKIDIVWMPESDFVGAGFDLNETDGDIHISDLVKNHVDAVKLDYRRLGLLAGYVARALKEDRWKRLTKSKVAKLLAEAVVGGRVSFDALTEKVQDEVRKHLKSR